MGGSAMGFATASGRASLKLLEAEKRRRDLHRRRRYSHILMNEQRDKDDDRNRYTKEK